MSFAVVNGAVCTCTFGAAPCPLIVTSQMSVLGTNLPIASIMDQKPANLATFGMCSSMANPVVSAATAAALGVLTPQPCLPVIAAPWTPGSPMVLVCNNPALQHNSQAMCAYAGVIKISNPGQQSLQIP